MHQKSLVFLALFPSWAHTQYSLMPCDTGAHTLIFTSGDAGSSAWRIPALVAAEGTLVAVADARRTGNGDLPNDIDLMARTSTDMGRTWSPHVMVADLGVNGASDPALAYVEEDGTLLCLFASHQGLFQSTPKNRIRLQVCRSYDKGTTWTAPEDISDQIYRTGWHAAWIASGSIHRAVSGRLMAAIGVRETEKNQLSNYMIYSDDGGATWQTAPGRACLGGDEAKMMSLQDGRLLMLIRAKGHRKATWSADQGLSWAEPVPVNDLIEPAVNGDLIRYCLPGTQKQPCSGPLLFSVASDPAERKNLTLFLSDDEGTSWTRRCTVFPGRSAYSALTVLPDGSIGVFYEQGETHLYDLYFARYCLQWQSEK